MSSSDIIVGYNKNDFFYVNAETNSGALTKANCTMNAGLHDPIWDVRCNATNFVDNSANCMVKELCINKEYAKKIKSMQQIHSGSDEQYENAKQVYDKTFAHTLNLGSGIIVLLLLMYKITKS